jgi:Mg/Co/Ni transporter MgtE
MTPTQEWFSGFSQVARQLLGFAPVLLSAALLTLVGWLLARLARFLASRAVTALLTSLGGRPSLRGAIVSSGVATQVPEDPAAASSIILTTVTAVVGFLTFLGFATLALGIL